MYFYYEATNHRADFGRINYQMGLVGFPDFNLIAAPTLLMLSQVRFLLFSSETSFPRYFCRGILLTFITGMMNSVMISLIRL